jgi:hypothetical protein
MTGTVFQTRNAVDGRNYRVSVVQTRKYVTYIGEGFLPGTKETNSLGITAEASVGRGKGLLSVMFPVLVIGYASDLPPKLPISQFCMLAQQITTDADIEVVRSGKQCQVVKGICDRYRVLATCGLLYHRFTFRPLPHLFIVDPR